MLGNRRLEIGALSVILSGVEGSNSTHQDNDKYRNLPEILREVVFGRIVQLRFGSIIPHLLGTELRLYMRFNIVEKLIEMLTKKKQEE